MLEQIRAGMAVVNQNLNYYAITLTGNERGELSAGSYTHFVGWGDPDMRTEIRVPSQVKPDWFIKIWEGAREGYSVVKNEDEWCIFYLLGGNGLVEESIARQHHPSLFETDPSVRLPRHEGFAGGEKLVSAALRRKPTRKLWREVTTRDRRRCRICHDSESDSKHFELNVHHIRPWGELGPTVEENLITLCRICHKQLNPHYNPSLFERIPKGESSHRDAVFWHRAIVYSRLTAVEDKPRERPSARGSRRSGT